MKLPQLSSAPQPDQLRALAEIVVLVGYADGTFTRAEQERLVARLGALSPEPIDPIWLEKAWSGSRPPTTPDIDWRSARLKTLGDILGTDELRRTAFALSLEIAHIDGGIGRREVALLVSTAEQLGLQAKAALDFLAEVEEPSGAPS